MDFSTCDLCDAYEVQIAEGSVRALPPVLRHFGGVTRFVGRAVTLQCFEDNGMVRKLLETAGEGRVLVIDGGASLRCALVGGNLAVLAQKNGWAGMLVHGCVRDVAELAASQVGICALAAMPVKSIRRGGGVSNVRIHFAGVAIAAGDWVYADADGILIADHALDVK